MAKKKRKGAKKTKTVKKKRVRTKKTVDAVIQNKQVAALPVIPAYDFRILEQNKQASVWDDE